MTVDATESTDDDEDDDDEDDGNRDLVSHDFEDRLFALLLIMREPIMFRLLVPLLALGVWLARRRPCCFISNRPPLPPSVDMSVRLKLRLLCEWTVLPLLFRVAPPRGDETESRLLLPPPPPPPLPLVLEFGSFAESDGRRNVSEVEGGWYGDGPDSGSALADTVPDEPRRRERWWCEVGTLAVSPVLLPLALADILLRRLCCEVTALVNSSRDVIPSPFVSRLLWKTRSWLLLSFTPID